MFLKILVFLCIYFTLNDVYSQLPAFPGAEGFGTNTPGGRGGRIIKVTNLHDGGEGSLRAAIEAEGPRIVLFSIGGIISLEDKLVIRNPYITIAGQTAPGGGICIRGEGIQIATHDVVVRYLRVRPGDIDFGVSNDWDSVDAIAVGASGREVYNVVIDHCSLSWAVDENLDLWYNAHDVTIQYSIISEALHVSKHSKGAHSKGLLIGSNATNVSIHHNIFAHNYERNPRVNGNSDVDIRNNIIYNSGGLASDFGNFYRDLKFSNINYVGNYLKEGRNTERLWEVVVREESKRLRLYVEGNVSYNKAPREDEWSIVRHIHGNPANSDFRVTEPFPFPNVTTLPAEVAYELLLKRAGANLPYQDPIDRKLIRDIERQEGGLRNSKKHVLEWPPYEKGITPIDTDMDGMPDHWEESYGLSAQIADSAIDPDNDGYTNIEEFINKTNPTSTEESPAMSPLSEEAAGPQGLFNNLSFDIEQNYPNPFEDLTSIRFSIARPSNVQMKILASDGSEVSTLMTGFMYEGKYEVQIEATDLVPGLYFLSLSTNDDSKMVKMLIK